MLAIEADELSKIYKGIDVPALDRISVKIDQGQIFTLLGRNGAGKTTFVRICATQLLPSSGTLNIFGYDVKNKAKSIRELISVVPQEGRPLRALTPWDHVYNWLKIRGNRRHEAKVITENILQRLELFGVKDKPAMNLSGGMKQKILVAMALAVDVELLFLDEPTIGLDPVSRRQVWSLIQELKKGGKTILLTTHYMDEAEILSDKILIIDNGKGVKEGTINDLRKVIPQNIRVDISKNSLDIESLRSYGTVIETGTDNLRLFTFESYLREIYNLAIKKNILISISPITLDDVFVSLVQNKNK
ncbi:MAG: ABC transporter ATP-binding protein [Nitrososphaeraceae archaeon]